MTDKLWKAKLMERKMSHFIDTFITTLNEWSTDIIQNLVSHLHKIIKTDHLWKSVVISTQWNKEKGRRN